MADDQLDVVQHPTLGTLKFPKDMPPDERNESIQRVLMTRPDAQAPPSVPMPKQEMHQSQLGRIDSSDPGIPKFGGMHGGTSDIMPRSSGRIADVNSPEMGAAALGGTAGIAGGLAAPKVVPAILKAAPYIAASEGINLARKHLPLGKYIPPGSEMIPLFMGGGKLGAKEAAAEEEATLAPKGEISRTPKPAEVESQLNDALGGKPLQPNVPLRAQGNRITSDISSQSKPSTSSAILNYKYNPVAQEMQVTTKAGAQYIHGDVSPAQAAEFEKAGSKGKAWGELKKNSTYVGKIVNGQRINAKPPSNLRSASPDDLTPILKESLQNVKAKKLAAGND